MDKCNFIIIDSNYSTRNSLAQALSKHGYVVQVDNVADLGAPYFEKAFVFLAETLIEKSDTCQALQDAGIFYPIVAYCSSPSLSLVNERLHGHCAGYVAWPGDENELRNTLIALTERSASQVRRQISEARACQKIAQLTYRERQVASGIKDGLSSKELAKPLGISFRTVERHRANIMKKFGTTKISSVIRILIEAELAGFTDEETKSGLAD